MGTKVYQYNPFNLITIADKDKSGTLTDYDDNIHFILMLERDKLKSSDENPFVAPMSLRGISGSAIWQAWWPSKDSVSAWHSKTIKAVGVQVSTSEKKGRVTIKAVKWKMLAHILMRQFSNLIPIFEMHFPGSSALSGRK